MSVLVTGATGFVGTAAVEELRRLGMPVSILCRHPDSKQARSMADRCAVKIISGDVTLNHDWWEQIAGVNAVIHLVGIIGQCGLSTYERVHVDGTLHVVEAMRLASIKRLVHMSAMGTRPDAASRYHQTKWAAEEIVRKSGLDYTIFRPSIIYGAHDQFVNLFAQMTRWSPILPVIGDGENCFQPISVEDVAAAFVRALSEPRSIGQVFDLGGSEIFSFNEILDEIMNACHRKRLKLHVPIWMAKIQAALLETLFPLLLRRPPPLNRDQIEMLQEDNTGNPLPAFELFDLEKRLFQDGIARYIR